MRSSEHASASRAVLSPPFRTACRSGASLSLGRNYRVLYPEVFRYSLNVNGAYHFRADWRYDEFRLSDDNHVLHGIEWCHATDSGRWLIEKSDVQHQYYTNGNG